MMMTMLMSILHHNVGKELKHLAVTLMQEKPMNTSMAREEDHVVIAAVVVVATFVAVEEFWFPFWNAAFVMFHTIVEAFAIACKYWTACFFSMTPKLCAMIVRVENHAYDPCVVFHRFIDSGTRLRHPLAAYFPAHGGVYGLLHICYISRNR
jgi:hypothetical protein